jgi:hypothetical protein
LESPNVINRGCWDITKGKVNNIFKDLFVDPLTHDGICVEKLDLQGSHKNHRIIKCPAKPREGYVYQKYIENKVDGLYIKYRVCYADGVKLVIKKYNKSAFSSDYIINEIIPKEYILTGEQEEILNIKCKEFGVDFGELDIMIYEGEPVVIDVNNIVGGGFIHAETGTEISDLMDQTFFDFIRDRVSRFS